MCWDEMCWGRNVLGRNVQILNMQMLNVGREIWRAKCGNKPSGCRFYAQRSLTFPITYIHLKLFVSCNLAKKYNLTVSKLLTCLDYSDDYTIE